MELDKKHKDARVIATQHAFSMKATVYICKGYQLRYEHNYIGSHIEKAVYDSKENKVTIFDNKENKVHEQAGKVAKVQNTPKLSKSADGKSGKNI